MSPYSPFKDIDKLTLRNVVQDNSQDKDEN